MSYNPIPPRVWPRVENRCAYDTDVSYSDTLLKQQLYKGNVLQYKGNSARLTKSQRYSQLANLHGPSRTKVFATQSVSYSNPNKTGLLRVGYTTFPYPNQITGAPNNTAGPFAYGIPDPAGCPTYSVNDGGTLICGTYANPCTQEIIEKVERSSLVCNPASASDVPGLGQLCWDNRIQPWFPRNRFSMNNSGTKWPTNYKGLVSAVDLSGCILKVRP